MRHEKHLMFSDAALCRRNIVESYGFNEDIYNKLSSSVSLNPPHRYYHGLLIPNYDRHSSFVHSSHWEYDMIFNQLYDWRSGFKDDFHAYYAFFVGSPVLPMYERELFMDVYFENDYPGNWIQGEALIWGYSMWGFIIESTVLSVSMRSMNTSFCENYPSYSLSQSNQQVVDEIRQRNLKIGMIVDRALRMGQHLSIEDEIEFGQFVLNDMNMRMWEYMFELMQILYEMPLDCYLYDISWLDIDYYWYGNEYGIYPFSWDESCRGGGGGGYPTPTEPEKPSTTYPRDYVDDASTIFAINDRNPEIPGQLVNTCVTSTMQTINHHLCGGNINEGEYLLSYAEEFEQDPFGIFDPDTGGVKSVHVPEFVEYHFNVVKESLSMAEAVDRGYVVMTVVPSHIPNSGHSVVVVGYNSDRNTYIYADNETRTLREAKLDYFMTHIYKLNISSCK